MGEDPSTRDIAQPMERLRGLRKDPDVLQERAFQD